MLGLPIDASANGHQIDQLIWYMHILMVVLFVGWGSFYVFTLFRFRQSNHPKADYVGAKGHTSTYLEAAVALVEVILLLGFSIPIYSRVVQGPSSDKEVLNVRVVAEQFAWNVQYPGPDGKFGKTSAKLVDASNNPMGLDKTDPAALDDFTTINNLYVPSGRPVVVSLTSKDVIHSFGLPNFRAKQDAIPGQEVKVWFEPAIVGKYDIRCSQLCGIGHYYMKGNVIVQSPDDFNKWVATQKPLLQAKSDDFWN